MCNLVISGHFDACHVGWESSMDSSITSGKSSLKTFCSSNLNSNCSRRLLVGVMGNIPVEKEEEELTIRGNTSQAMVYRLDNTDETSQVNGIKKIVGSIQARTVTVPQQNTVNLIYRVTGTVIVVQHLVVTNVNNHWKTMNIHVMSRALKVLNGPVHSNKKIELNAKMNGKRKGVRVAMIYNQ